MTSNDNPQVVSSSRPIRERVGLAVDGANVAAAVAAIVMAENAGVRQIWMGQILNQPDDYPDVSSVPDNDFIADYFIKIENKIDLEELRFY